MTYANNRRDANEHAILDVLRGAGWFIQSCARNEGHDLTAVGCGVTFGMPFFIEIKDGRKSPSARPLTRAERAFQREVEARGVRLWILLDHTDAEHLVRGEYDQIAERPEYRNREVKTSRKRKARK